METTHDVSRRVAAVSGQPGLRLVPITANRPGKVTLDGEVMPTITAALTGARPGSVVEVGRGRYTGATESFPLRVGDRVTLRGPEPPKIPDEAKKFLPTPPPAELVTDGPLVEVTGDEAHVAHLHITNRRPGAEPSISVRGTTGSTIDTCEITGRIDVTDAHRATLRWSSIDHGRLVAVDATDLSILGGTFTGSHGSRPLIELRDCARTRIEAVALPDAGVGVQAAHCDDVGVSGCAILADADAVRVIASTDVYVTGNRLRGATAVHLADCRGGQISANGVERADVAFHLEQCADVEIGFNHIAEARVELLDTQDEDDNPSDPA